ncbi:DUF4253 domain-containing protein [Novipirellula sp. SH528]|uniref:DUF4253 domain-containing protein n=1 Tax=Novipirellula sp. SH528 TaxID=3454466 RepID=UPI003FA10A8B
MDKYETLKACETSAPNQGMSTDDIITTLSKWDAEYGVTIKDVDSDRFVATFGKLPDDLNSFANDLYAFCPNILDQDFSQYPEILESADVLPADYIEQVRSFSEGIDFNDKDYDIQLLKRSLTKFRSVSFMWD